MREDLKVLKVEKIKKAGNHNEYRGNPLPAYAVFYDHPKNLVAYIDAKSGIFQKLKTVAMSRAVLTKELGVPSPVIDKVDETGGYGGGLGPFISNLQMEAGNHEHAPEGSTFFSFTAAKTGQWHSMYSKRSYKSDQTIYSPTYVMPTWTDSHYVNDIVTKDANDPNVDPDSNLVNFDGKRKGRNIVWMIGKPELATSGFFETFSSHHGSGSIKVGTKVLADNTFNQSLYFREGDKYYINSDEDGVVAYSSFDLSYSATSIAIDGTVTITGCPTGTEIFLDGVSSGTYSGGSLTLTGTTAGSFALIFKKDKYYDAGTQITVTRYGA